jgi:thiosulfate dehydrogenase [quinone] large subunit
MLTTAAAKALAVLRIVTGFIFLWAFLDKMFGLGYSTPAAKAWINGGSPTKGFPRLGRSRPAAGLFPHHRGRQLGRLALHARLLGVGPALIFGIGLRIAAVTGTALMAMMWAAEWPLARGSSNPIVDYHVIYALAAVVFALSYAGHTWGPGGLWSRLALVQEYRWLI